MISINWFLNVSVVPRGETSVSSPSIPRCNATLERRIQHQQQKKSHFISMCLFSSSFRTPHFSECCYRTENIFIKCEKLRKNCDITSVSHCWCVFFLFLSYFFFFFNLVFTKHSDDNHLSHTHWDCFFFIKFGAHLLGLKHVFQTKATWN